MTEFLRIRLLTGFTGNSLWNAYGVNSRCLRDLRAQKHRISNFIHAVSQIRAESVGRAGKQIWWSGDVDEQKFVQFFDGYVILTGI